MKQYVIEYHFGADTKVPRVVESESNDLNLILNTNTRGDKITFTDKLGILYSFQMSDVKYMRVYPVSQPKPVSVQTF